MRVPYKAKHFFFCPGFPPRTFGDSWLCFRWLQRELTGSTEDCGQLKFEATLLLDMVTIARTCWWIGSQRKRYVKSCILDVVSFHETGILQQLDVLLDVRNGVGLVSFIVFIPGMFVDAIACHSKILGFGRWMCKWRCNLMGASFTPYGLRKCMDGQYLTFMIRTPSYKSHQKSSQCVGMIISSNILHPYAHFGEIVLTAQVFVLNLAK